MNEKAMQLIWAVPEKKLSISFEKKLLKSLILTSKSMYNICVFSKILHKYTQLFS